MTKLLEVLALTFLVCLRLGQCNGKKLMVTACDGDTDDESLPSDLSVKEVAELEEKAKKWVQDHQAKVVFDIDDHSSGFKENPKDSNIYSYTNSKSNLNIGLIFKESVEKTDTVKSLKKKFQGFTADSIPVKGLKARDVWEIGAVMPKSQTKDGVTISSFDGSHIGLEVDTKLFAIYGRRKDVEVPADASCPPGSFFQTKQNMRLQLKICAAFKV